MPHARAALELGERLEDRILLVTALMTVVTFELALGNGLRKDLLERALRLETDLGDAASDIPLLLRPHGDLWLHRRLEGDLDAARSHLGRFLELTEQLDPKYRPGGLTWLGDIELHAGNWDRAASLADEAEVLAGQFGQEMLEHRALRAHLRALRGDVEGARSEAQEMLVRALELGKRNAAAQARHVLGFLELTLGNPAEAHRFLEAAVAALHAAGIREPARLAALPDDVEALVLLGRLAEAEALLAPFEERARALDRPLALGTSGRCRALLLAAHGDLSEALAAAEKALEHHQRVLMPFERGRTLLVLGAMRRRAKRRRAARETLQASLAIFEELGAPLWIEKAQAELARIAGRAPSTGELTPTELRVAALVAEGRTNREVGAALHLSERTVEGNLSRIYDKLGVRSRTELAHRFAAQPSAPADS
jgi:DNA-binding CsgD family transcriptional regulator